MKVYEFRRREWGKAFDRISRALHDFAPEYVEWVDNPANADVNIVHIVGYGEFDIAYNLKNTVVFQHCYFTADANLHDYASIWEKSLLSISFHPLNEYTNKKFNFYMSPLGADPSIFKIDNSPHERDISVITTGHIATTESIDKLYLACKKLNTFMLHTGHNFGYEKAHYKFLDYMRDEDLAYILNYIKYVSCLRRDEGFELLGVEGLFCGARPIVFDLPTYQSYKNHAIFIKQDDNIVDSLVSILSTEPAPILHDEYNEILNKFSWSVIMDNIYKRIKEAYDAR